MVGTIGEAKYTGKMVLNAEVHEQITVYRKILTTTALQTVACGVEGGNRKQSGLFLVVGGWGKAVL